MALKRLLALLVCLVGLSVPTWARQRAFGYCEQGNGTVVTGGVTSTSIVQQSFPSCTITVYNTGTLVLATIYSDNAGTVKANPFTADATGFWFFYADNNRYDVQLSGGGITSPFTWADVMLTDPAQLTSSGTTVTFSATPTFDASVNSIFLMTLTGNVTASTVSNAVNWAEIKMVLCQDGTGGRTFAWPANFLRPPTIAPSANACTNTAFLFDGTNWRQFAATGDSLTATKIFNGTGVLTLPTTTDTIVGRATADTLTNKTLTSPTITTPTFGAGNITVTGSSSGTQIWAPGATISGTLTFPSTTDTIVGRATSDTLTNKTLTAPVIATIVNTGTLTLPTSTDTLVGRATTDTLTNKTFDQTSNLGMVRLVDTLLAAPATNITFSSISGSYKSLMIVIQARTDNVGAVDNIAVQFNGDTGANYDNESLTGNNVTAAATSALAATSASSGTIPSAGAARANIAGTVVITIPNYAGGTFEKSFTAVSTSVDSTAANNWTVVRSNSWRSTAGITSIKLFPVAGTNFVTGTRITLYGLN